jgi:hypothetical protein
MLDLKIVLEEPPKSSLTNLVKFYRRLELTSKTRLDIAYQAMNARWGEVTKLSEKYQVSRKFVYEQRNRLVDQLETLFGFHSPQMRCEWSVLSLIVQLRLIGHTSLHAISAILKALPIHSLKSSVGSISQVLQQMGNALCNQIAWQGQCVVAMDELFIVGNEPILVTVDLYSGAILRIDLHTSLTRGNWENHLNHLVQGGITPLKVIADDGSALQSARKTVLKDVRYQPDTFHAVSHRMGIFKTRLLQQVEAAITTEYDREKRFWAAKSEKTVLKVAEQWLQAQIQTQQSIQVYEDFCFLYYCILAQFNVFNAQGVVRQRHYAEQEVQTALDWLQTLPINGLQAELTHVIKAMPLLFDFLDTAQEGVQQLESFVDFAALPYWTQAWQMQKTAAKIKGQYALQKKYLVRYHEFIAFLKLFYQKKNELQFRELQEAIFKILDIACSQASSAVENANSFIRPFLDQARGQIEQHTLNLILFYYNHRRFTRGKRKGFAPIELLTGQPLHKPWYELLLEQL